MAQFIPKKAIQIKNTPAGNIAATNVQAAINELDSEKQPIGNYLTAETDPVFLASEAADFVAGDKAKLDGIEAGAEVNNISDVNATDLTDGGETALHSHAGAGSSDSINAFLLFGG